MQNIKSLSLFLCLGLFLLACTPTPNNPTDTTDTTETTSDTKPETFVDNSSPLATISDTTAQTIMERLFGSYSEDEKKSLLEAGFVKETELIERANMDTNDDLKAQMEYKSTLGDGRILFVISANSEGNECHVCAPIIGAGLLYPNGKEWDIKGFKFFDTAGKYGIAPVMETQQISPNDYGLVQSIGDIHMGHVYEAFSLHSVNNGFKEVFSSSVHHDNGGTCDQDGDMPDLEPCFENDTKVTYVPSDNGYYEIHTHKTGTDWDYDNSEFIKLDEKKTYTYQDGEYK